MEICGMALNPRWHFSNLSPRADRSAVLGAKDLLFDTTIGSALFIYCKPPQPRWIKRLLHSIGNAGQKIGKVWLTTGEEFLRAYSEAVERREETSFIRSYETTSILIVADFQVLEGTPAGEAFFKIFRGMMRRDGKVAIETKLDPEKIELGRRLMAASRQCVIADAG